MANKNNDDMIGLAAAGLVGILAIIFGPQLLKGLGGGNSQPQQSEPLSPPPKKSGCSACSMGG